MVSLDSILASCSGLLAAAAAEPTAKMPPTMRAAVLMALLGIALVGLLLIAIVLLGGSWVRRQGKHRRGSAVPPDRAPLSPSNGRGVTPGVPSTAQDEATEP